MAAPHPRFIVSRSAQSPELASVCKCGQFFCFFQHAPLCQPACGPSMASSGDWRPLQDPVLTSSQCLIQIPKRENLAAPAHLLVRMYQSWASGIKWLDSPRTHRLRLFNQLWWEGRQDPMIHSVRSLLLVRVNRKCSVPPCHNILNRGTSFIENQNFHLWLSRRLRI